MDEDLGKMHLVYVKLMGENDNGGFEYEMYFSETPDIVWGSDWAEQCPAAIGDIPPDEKAITTIKRIISPYKIYVAQENYCFSMQDCIDGIISLCWCFDSNDSLLFKFKFAEKYNNVADKLKEIKIDIV